MCFLCHILKTAFLLNLFGTEGWALLEKVVFYTSLSFLYLLIVNCFEFGRRLQKEDWEYWNRCEKILTFPCMSNRAFFEAAVLEDMNDVNPVPVHMDTNHDPLHPDVSGFFLLTIWWPKGHRFSVVLWRLNLITKRFFQVKAKVFSEQWEPFPRRIHATMGSAVVNEYFFLQFSRAEDAEHVRMGVWILNTNEGTCREVYLDSPQSGIPRWADSEFESPEHWAGIPLADGSYYVFHVDQMTEEQRQTITIHKYIPDEADRDRWIISRTSTFHHSTEEFTINTSMPSMSWRFCHRIVFVLDKNEELDLEESEPGLVMRSFFKPDSIRIVYDCLNNSWKRTTQKEVLEETQTENIELQKTIVQSGLEFSLRAHNSGISSPFHFMGRLYVPDATRQREEGVELIYTAPNPTDPKQTDFFSMRLQPKSLKRRALEEIIKNRPEVLQMNLEQLRNVGILPLAMAEALAEENESVSSQSHPIHD